MLCPCLGTRALSVYTRQMRDLTNTVAGDRDPGIATGITVTTCASRLSVLRAASKHMPRAIDRSSHPFLETTSEGVSDAVPGY